MLATTWNWRDESWHREVRPGEATTEITSDAGDGVPPERMGGTSSPLSAGNALIFHPLRHD